MLLVACLTPCLASVAPLLFALATAALLAALWSSAVDLVPLARLAVSVCRLATAARRPVVRRSVSRLVRLCPLITVLALSVCRRALVSPLVVMSVLRPVLHLLVLAAMSVSPAVWAAAAVALWMLLRPRLRVSALAVSLWPVVMLHLARLAMSLLVLVLAVWLALVPPLACPLVPSLCVVALPALSLLSLVTPRPVALAAM